MKRASLQYRVSKFTPKKVLWDRPQVPVVAGFDPSNLGPLVNCPTKCALSLTHGFYENLQKMHFYSVL